MAGESDLTNIPRGAGRPRTGAAKRQRTPTGRRAPVPDPKVAEPALQRQTELLTAVRKAQGLYASRHDPEEVFRQLLHVLVSATGSQAGFLSEVHYDVDGNPYRSSLAVCGMPWDEDARRLDRDLASQNLGFPNLNTLAGAPVLERRIIIANEAARHPRAAGLPKRHPPIDCFIGIPLFFGDDLIGLAGLANRPGGYVAADADFIEPLTSACANLIWAQRVLREEKESKAALRESEERYRALAEASPSSIEVVQNGKFAYVNPAGARMLGFTNPEEALGKSYMEFVAPEWRQLCAARMAQADAGRTNPPAEFEMARKDGTRIAIESVSAPITYQGRPAMIVIGHNVTGRKLAERSLAESQARLRQLYDAAPDGIVLADAATGFIVDANPAASRLIGRPPQEIIGLHFTRLHPPRLAEASKAGFNEQVSLKPGKPVENWILRPDGREVPVEITAMPVKLNDRTFLQGIFRDISKRKQYEEELKLSQTRLRNLYHELQAAREKERRHVAREIHDELGQSLTVLKIDLAWLKHRLAPDQDPLLRKLDDMDSIVDATLQTVQRVSAELRPGILDSLGLTATVEWFVRDFEKRAEIQCDLSIDPDEIEADPGLATDLFRILQEALTNVARHARASRLRVRLRQTPDAIHLNVADNGVGLSEEQASRSTSFGILGMRERVFARGGAISIQGVRGEGTSISVCMPIIERQA